MLFKNDASLRACLQFSPILYTDIHTLLDSWNIYVTYGSAYVCEGRRVDAVCEEVMPDKKILIMTLDPERLKSFEDMASCYFHEVLHMDPERDPRLIYRRCDVYKSQFEHLNEEVEQSVQYFHLTFPEKFKDDEKRHQYIQNCLRKSAENIDLSGTSIQDMSEAEIVRYMIRHVYYNFNYSYRITIEDKIELAANKIVKSNPDLVNSVAKKHGMRYFYK